MKTKNKLFLGVVFLLMLALAACGGKDTPSGTNDDGSKSETKKVPIGYTGPLSGPAAIYGENTLNGLKLAAEEINAAGGFEVDGQQYEIDLVILDDKYTPAETASNAKRLVQQNKTKVIYSPFTDGISAMQVFNEQEDFLIHAYSSEPGLIERGNSLTWQVVPPYKKYAEPYAIYEMEKFGKKLALLPPTDEYGKNWAESIKPVWEEKGGEVVYEASIDFAKDTDFYTIVTNALKNDPDVLFIGGPSEPTALVAKQARELGFEGGFMIMDQAKMEEMIPVLGGDPETLNGSIGVLPLVNVDYPGTKAFIEKYNEKYGKDPVAEPGVHYLTLYWLVEAMKSAGTVDDPKAIRAALNDGVKNIPEDKLVYPVKSVTEEGATLGAILMAVVENGEIKAITHEDLGLKE